MIKKNLWKILRSIFAPLPFIGKWLTKGSMRCRCGSLNFTPVEALVVGWDKPGADQWHEAFRCQKCFKLHWPDGREIAPSAFQRNLENSRG